MLFYLLIIQLTVYKRIITRFIAGDKVVFQGVKWVTWLASDNSWARAHMLEVNYLVQTWTVNANFMQNLRSWSVPVWLVLLRRRSSTAPRRTWSASTWLPGNCTGLADSFQQTVSVSKFPTLAGIFTKQSSCYDTTWHWQWKFLGMLLLEPSAWFP